MTAYTDYRYYRDTFGGEIITADVAEKAFQAAADTIDTLTYSRINERGFENLTAFQKRIIARVTCALAEWQTLNSDLLDNPYGSYSINGVSASCGQSPGVKVIGNVQIPTRLYAELVKTGLCTRRIC